MKFNEYGQYEAALTDQFNDADGRLALVCPFTGKGPNETELGHRLFEASGARFDDRLGHWLSLYAGHVATAGYRERGSSGGGVSWVLETLLRQNLVDAVIHVRPSTQPNNLFAFEISDSADSINLGAKSRYYPVEMSSVLQHVLSTPGRYALVGLPCFVKAVRLLALEHPVFAERIRFTVGLVCGHLKSRRFADFLAWQCGVKPGELAQIDFRYKLPTSNAGDYGVQVVARDGRKVVRPMHNTIANNWGYGLFKYSACDYCDDVMAETADITIGDAWIAPYDKDFRGSNIVIVRNAQIEILIRQAVVDGDLCYQEIDADAAALSQAGGLRHRRAGLAYRLAWKDRAGEWRPPKRVAPDFDDTSRYARVQKIRLDLSKTSAIAFEKAVIASDFTIFIGAITPLTRACDLLSRTLSRAIMRRVFREPLKSVRRSLRRIFRR
jgi:coenzyme F420-reducing hydrogenase beta subunit